MTATCWCMKSFLWIIPIDSTKLIMNFSSHAILESYDFPQTFTEFNNLVAHPFDAHLCTCRSEQFVATEFFPAECICDENCCFVFMPCHPLSNIVHRVQMAFYVDDTNFQSRRVCSVKSINGNAARCRHMMEKRVSLHGTFAMKEKFIYCRNRAKAHTVQ